jgi:dolichyldiphosphatase
MALGALVPQLILVGLATLAFFHHALRRREALKMLGGLLCNQIINHLVKHTVREPRPTFGVQVKSDYGWPSAHAQFMGFYASFIVCLMHSNPRMNRNIVAFYALLNGLLAIHVCASRVMFGFHTSNQVIWGLVFGVPIGFAWHVLLQKVSRGRWKHLAFAVAPSTSQD